MHIRLILIIVALILPLQAIASLQICNRTNKEIATATMAKDDNGVWRSSGWFVIEPTECKELIQGALREQYYYYYAIRSDAIYSGSGDDGAEGCIRDEAFTEIDSTSDCPDGFTQVLFRKIDVGDKTAQTLNLTKKGETVSFSEEENIEKACQVLHAKLDRPRLRTEKVAIAHYTDLLTLPQTKTECTNTYDTGVPDPSTCTTSWDDCASKLSLPFGGWTCLPGSTTRCSNVIACNTWATYKKTMECDVMVQMKLPDFIEQPLSRFIDNSFDVIETTQAQVRTALPLACVPPDVRSSASPDAGQAVASEIGRVIQRRLQEAIEREAKEWIVETGVKTVAASIPSGGVGGAALMSSEFVQFVRRVHNVIQPIIKTGNELKATAEDLGFSTSCGWNDWHRAF